jgi:hypothetical protein
MVYSANEIEELHQLVRSAEHLKQFLAGLVVDSYAAGQVPSDYHAGLVQDLQILADTLRHERDSLTRKRGRLKVA